MASILFPQSTAPADHPHESSGRLVNCLSEPLQPGAPSGHKVIRSPGLSSFADTTQTTYRGSIYVEPYIYSAYSDVLVRTDNAAVVTNIDTLIGSNPVTFARNNKVPVPDRVCVTDSGAFVFTESSVASLNEPALPAPNSIAAHDGYFLFTIADGRCFASGLNATTIDANHFVKAESNPDGLLRVIPYGRDILLAGPQSFEVFWNAGNPTGFPYSRVTTIPLGLIGQRAIAGWEPEFETRIIFVASDFSVRLMDAYRPVEISPPQLKRLIGRVGDKTQIDVSVFVAGGKAFAKVAGPGFAWVYDFSTAAWHERQSYLSVDWRFTGQTVAAFGTWYGGDSQSGRLLEIVDGHYKEVGDPLAFLAESIAMEAFPARVQVPRVDFNFVTGTGIAAGEDPIERTPRCAILWSDDGGTNWSIPLLRDLDAQQVARYHPFVTRTGLSTAKGRRWRVIVTDPVYVGLMGADMRSELRAA